VQTGAPMNRLLLCLAVAGCTGGKPAPTDSFGDLEGLDQKSDAFSKKMKIVGSLAVGQTSATVRYSKSPIYRGFTLAAKGPALLDFWVRSKQGDSVAWLLDSKYKILAVNDDADDTTYDSHIRYELPGGGASYYIVFRDYSYESHNFAVEVKPYAPAPSQCVPSLADGSDDPPVEIGCMEEVLNNHLGSYQLYDHYEPACIDWSSAQMRAAVAEDVRANSGIDWQDATPPVASAVKAGGADFAAQLQTAREELRSYANSSLPKGTGFLSCYPGTDQNIETLIGDSLTNPNAFLEFNLHVEAEECSQNGHVRIDTRSGTVLILREHGC
jgi:hypothetical protein